MSRLVMFLTPLIVAGTTAISLQSCGEVRAAPESSTPRQPLLLLEDGSTMIAPRSELDREWTAWLSSTDAATAKFEFGSDAFVEGRSALTPEGLGRAARLGLLLRSSPDAKLLLPQADENSIANSRANTLARFLKGRGILADQVAFESVDVQPSDDVAFLLTRRKPSA